MYFKRLFQDAKMMFANPKGFFSGMDKSGGIGAPILKALGYSAGIGILYIVDDLMRPQFANLGASLLTFIMAIIYGMSGLFLGGLVLMLVGMILGAKAKYSDSLHILAAVFPVFIVISLLGLVLSFNGLLAWLVMLAAWAYTFYLFHSAVTYGMNGNERASGAVAGVLALLVAMAILSPMVSGIFSRAFQSLKMRASSKAQELSQRIAGRPVPTRGFGANQPFGAARPMPMGQMQRPVMFSTAAAPGMAQAGPANYARPVQNYDSLRKMIQSNTRLTKQQKEQALKRLDEAEKNRAGAPK